MKAKRTDDILVSLDQQMQDSIEESETKARDFFRGSEIGNCSNQINFRRRGTPVKDIGLHKARFLEDGHLHQAVLSAEMKKAGVKVIEEEQEKVYRTKILGLPITIISHKDGAIKVGKEKKLLEVKSVKEEKFGELVKSGDVSAYYDQIQGYMYVFHHDECYLMIVDRNNSMRQEFTIKRDPERIKFLLKKLYRIEKDLKEGKQSTRDYPRTSRECGWCPYYEPCWGVKKGAYIKGERKEKAVEIEGKKELKAFDLAVDLYRKHMRLKEESKNYKEEADGLMEIIFRKFKADRVHGAGGSVSRVVSTRSTPDKAFIKELIVKGAIPVNTQEIVSLRYNINGQEDEEE